MVKISVWSDREQRRPGRASKGKALQGVQGWSGRGCSRHRQAGRQRGGGQGGRGGQEGKEGSGCLSPLSLRGTSAEERCVCTAPATLPRVRLPSACSAAVPGARTWSWWRRRGLSSRRGKGPAVPAAVGDTPPAPPRPSANEAPEGSQGTRSLLASPLDATPPAACDSDAFGAKKGFSYH